MIPGNARNVIREQVAHTAVERMSKVLKFVKLGLSLKLQCEKKKLQSFDELKGISGNQANEDTMLEVFRDHALLAEFMESLEKAKIAFFSHESKKCIMKYQDGEIKYQGDDLADEKGISKLLSKSFLKLSKVLFFLKEKLNLNHI